jgi:hypothetical protein
MEMTVILKFRKWILDSAFFVKTIIYGDGETAGCWVPKHDYIGVVTKAKGNVSAGLGAEMAVRAGAGVVEGLLIVTNGAPGEERAPV